MYRSFDLPKLISQNPDYVSKTPFEHQKDAFEKLSNLFTFSNNEHKAGILVFPTGAGKTFTSVRWICKKVLPQNVKVLWLAHTAHLLEQAFETFEKELLEIPPSRKTINTRVVSSQPSHSRPSQIELTDDVLIITTQTAISNFETNALDGAGQIKKTAFEKFIEYSKTARLFVVLDEAHHAPAYGCRNLLIGGSKFQNGIKQLVPNCYFLGLTATPNYTDERRRGWLWEIYKDKIIYEADKTDLTKQNILAVPNYIQKNTGEEIEVDDTLFNILTRQHKDLPEYLIEKLARDSKRNDYIVNDYLEHYQTYGKTIIFADRWFQCIYIKEQLMKKFREKNIPVKADAVYSHIDTTPDTAEERNKRTDTENAKVLQDFKNNKLEVLLNVRMLSEGTNVPDVNTVFITRQTTSSNLLIQMIGRALRGKKAGGGQNKDTANIVFFVDNWRKIINFATPDREGSKDDIAPKTKGYYPIEYISIKLVEELSQKIDSGVVSADVPYLDTLPVGWYETEILVTVEEETNLFKEFVIVYENTKEKFEKFIKDISQNLLPEWENDNLNDEFAQNQAKNWLTTFFDETDNTSKTLDMDLIKIARHIAQAKLPPPFYSFEERDKHDLSKIAEELIEFNEYIVQEKLQATYNNPAYMWKSFYKSYDRFKTAFDSNRNYIYHKKKYGTTEPLVNNNPPTSITQKIDELTEKEKEQVLIIDKYTCQCCGKSREKVKRLRLQIDHITPIKFGGETTMDNSQTLCSVCNNNKGINEINFRIHQTPLKAAKIDLEVFDLSETEAAENVLRRIVNMFYHCQAVADIKLDDRPRSKHRYNWEIHLYEGNNPDWLRKHSKKLLNFIKSDLEEFNKVQELKIF